MFYVTKKKIDQGDIRIHHGRGKIWIYDKWMKANPKRNVLSVKYILCI